MKKRIISLVLALTTVLTMNAALAAPASAKKADADELYVRVNGHMVNFPDAQPYVDAQGRTMLPIRFVAEALGAKVDWNSKTRTATISRKTTTLAVTLNSKTVKASKEGDNWTITMDTVAVRTSEGRTYVPVRFVAEALGAFVDFSDYYRVVGIYLSDVLSANDIEQLRAYDYTQPRFALSTYEKNKAEYLAGNFDESAYTFEETYRDSAAFDSFANNFANAHEFPYQSAKIKSSYSHKGVNNQFKSDMKIHSYATDEEYFDAIVKEAVDEIAYKSDNLTIDFYTDNSCLYQPDSEYCMETCVRGNVVARVKSDKLTVDESMRLGRLGIHAQRAGLTANIDVDAHVCTDDVCLTAITNIVPLRRATFMLNGQPIDPHTVERVGLDLYTFGYGYSENGKMISGIVNGHIMVNGVAID